MVTRTLRRVTHGQCRQKHETSALSVSLEGGGHGSLLSQSLGVQGLSEGGGLVGVGGYYGGTVGNGVRRGTDVAGGGLQMLPCEEVGLAAREVSTKSAQGQYSPGEGGEEAEGDDSSGGIRALGQRQLVWRGRLPLIGQKAEAHEPQEASYTGEAEVQQHSTTPVLHVAHGGEVDVQDEETDAADETGHAHRHAIVTGVGVVVEHTQQPLATDVDVALVDDAAEHHNGENP